MRLVSKVITRTLFSFLATMSASGLIFRDGPSPAANTETAPTGDYAGSGWQHQVRYLTSHATIISPKHFITANHLGNNQDEIFQAAFFNGVEDRTYAIKGRPVRLGLSDLQVFEIWETFGDYAELYTATDEAGKGMVIHGRGIGRGEELAGKGWKWGPYSSQKSRWGRNTVDGSVKSGIYDYLYFDFDDVFNQDEVGAANRDSGGGWFIKDGATWKLAAVTYSVDAFYALNGDPANNERFGGVFYDAGGLYLDDDEDGWDLIPTKGVSVSFNDRAFYRKTHTYGSRISSQADEIEMIIAPALAWENLTPEEKFAAWLSYHGASGNAGEDFDFDGVSNLEEYYAESDPAITNKASPALTVAFGFDGSHRLTLRETLDYDGRGLTAIIEGSPDFANWTEMTDLTEISNVRFPKEGVRTRVLATTGGGAGPFYYRLKITL